MARGRDLRLLLRIVAVHREARLRGMPAHELLGMALERRRTRRELLGSILAAGAALLGAVGLAGCRRRAAPGRATEEPHIIVVGAGLAGMTCAYRLAQAGLRCTVHEAAEAPGGRTRTLRGFFAGGLLAEQGGEFVDSTHAALWRLAGELELELEDLWLGAPDGAHVFRPGGRPYSLAEATEDFAPVYDALQWDLASSGPDPRYDASTEGAVALDRLSAAEWIDRRVPGGRASRLGALLDIVWTTESGADTGDLSALTLVRALGESPREELWLVGDSDERFRVEGGNDQVVARLAEELPEGTVRTGSALVALRALGDGRLVCTFEEDGRRRDVRCARAVLALPFTLLREVDTEQAPFSPLKRRAIAELPLGTSSKLHLGFERRVWLEQGLDGWTETSRLQTTWDESAGQPGTGGILVVYNGGARGAAWSPGAAHRPADAETGGAALDALDRLIPGLREAWTGQAWLDHWRASAWHRGAYSYYGVGQTTRFRGIERLREGGVHFAGEHTSLTFPGYMEGAVESGERAAEEVASDLAPGYRSS